MEGVNNMTTLTSILKTDYPIIVGPMAWTSMAPLVGAVANAGALGVLGVGFSPNDVLEAQIKETQALTRRPFAINVTISTAAEANLTRITEIAKAHHIQFIYADSFEGLNAPLTKKWFQIWHAADMTIISKVMTAAEARVADQCGADVIIAKGVEGGGHMSKVGTLALVPEVVDCVHHAQVVASGGIVDGRGYAAACMLGASGIEMGTAFLAAEEGNISQAIKQAVVNAHAEDVVMTGYSTGAPCWQIKNTLSDQLNQIEQQYSPQEAAPKVAKLASGSLRIASQEGEIDQRGAIMPGQAVTLVTAIKPVAEILKTTYQSGRQLLKNAAQIAE